MTTQSEITPDKFHSYLPIFLLVLSLTIVSQFWTGYHVASQDGPVHAYYGRVLFGHFTGVGEYREYFDLAPEPPPYLLTHISLAGLGNVFGVINGERIFVSLVCILLIAGFIYLCRSINPSNTFLSILGFCYVSSQLLFLGFYNYCLATAFLTFCIGFWFKNRDELKGRHWVALCFYFGLIYLAHPVVFLASLLIISIDRLTSSLSAYKMIRREDSWIRKLLSAELRIALAAAPWIILMGAYALRHGGDPGAFSSLKERIRWFVRFGYMYPFTMDFYPLLAVTLFVCGAAIYWILRLRQDVLRNVSNSSLLVSASALFLVMLFVPKSINGAGYLPHRFPLLILICIIAWLATFDYGRVAKTLITLFGVTCLAVMLGVNYQGLKRIAQLSEDEFDPNLWNAVAPNSVLRFSGTGGKIHSEDVGNFVTIGRGGYYLAAERNSTVILLDSEFATNHFPLSLKETYRANYREDGGFDPRTYSNLTGLPVDYLLIYDAPGDLDLSRIGFSLVDYEQIYVSRPDGYIRLFKLKN